MTSIRRFVCIDVPLWRTEGRVLYGQIGIFVDRYQHTMLFLIVFLVPRTPIFVVLCSNLYHSIYDRQLFQEQFKEKCGLWHPVIV